MKHLIWLPLSLYRLVQLMLPRSLFLATYEPATIEERERSQDLANAAGLVAYKLKKATIPKENQ